jgi:phage gp36-like protein
MAENLTYTVWQDWVDRAESETRLKMFAPGDTADDHPRVKKAETAAVNTMEDYLRKRGFKLPLDAPLAEHVKEHLISIGLEFLTMRSENRVDNIDKNAKLARTFFKEVASGHDSLTNADSTTPQIIQQFDFNYKRSLDDSRPSDDSVLSKRLDPL